MKGLPGGFWGAGVREVEEGAEGDRGVWDEWGEVYSEKGGELGTYDSWTWTYEQELRNKDKQVQNRTKWEVKAQWTPYGETV